MSKNYRVEAASVCTVMRLEGDAMQQDGFPHNVAVWLGFAFAFALSLLTALAFGGFPLP